MNRKENSSSHKLEEYIYNFEIKLKFKIKEQISVSRSENLLLNNLNFFQIQQIK